MKVKTILSIVEFRNNVKMLSLCTLSTVYRKSVRFHGLMRKLDEEYVSKKNSVAFFFTEKFSLLYN